jgi:hypothetical protein
MLPPRSAESWAMVDRPQKITFGEMRDTGVRGILIYCSDYKCSHSTATSADQWTRHMRRILKIGGNYAVCFRERLNVRQSADVKKLYR